MRTKCKMQCLKNRDHFQDQCVDVKIILKWCAHKKTKYDPMADISRGSKSVWWVGYETDMEIFGWNNILKNRTPFLSKELKQDKENDRKNMTELGIIIIGQHSWCVRHNLTFVSSRRIQWVGIPHPITSANKIRGGLHAKCQHLYTLNWPSEESLEGEFSGHSQTSNVGQFPENLQPGYYRVGNPPPWDFQPFKNVKYWRPR